MNFTVSVIPALLAPPPAALHAADGRQRHPFLCQTPVAFLAVVWVLAQSAVAQPQWRNGEGENVSPRLADGREAPGVLAQGDAAGRPQTRDFSAPAMPAAAPNDEPAAANDSALDVTRFGARPDDGEDDTDAFLAAFREAQAEGAKRIVIPKGRYELRADGNPERPDVLFPVTGIDGLSIEGDGAELMMSGTAALFSFHQCRHVTVSGLTVDWARPPFSEGTVLASAPQHFDVEVRDEYPVEGGEPVVAFMSYHADTRLPDGSDGLDVYDSVERTELIAPQVLRVHLRREIPVPADKLLVLRHTVYGFYAFSFHRCTDVTLRNVTVHTAPGMALVAERTTDITLGRFNVRIRPGSGRLMSTTADATHFAGCSGTVTIEDCLFEGMGDDGVNIKSGLYLTVRQRVDDHTVLGQHNLKMADLPDPGDTLEMARTDTLSPFASGTVQEAAMEPGEGNMHRIRFEEPLPAELREGDVLGNATRVARLRLARSTVRANRARGVLCQTRDAIIEDCTFQDCTGAGVMVLTETVHFHESIGTRDVIVRNNRFENCNHGAGAAEAALCALAYVQDFAYPAEPGVHRNLTLEGNQIVRTDESGIFAAGVDGLTLRNNTVEQSGLRGSRPHGKDPIWIENCANVIRE
jgi:parallel beta-helix repeat protein